MGQEGCGVRRDRQVRRGGRGRRVRGVRGVRRQTREPTCPGCLARRTHPPQGTHLSLRRSTQRSALWRLELEVRAAVANRLLIPQKAWKVRRATEENKTSIPHLRAFISCGKSRRTKKLQRRYRILKMPQNSPATTSRMIETICLMMPKH